MDEDAVAFVRAFFEQAKPVAAICHAPVDAGRGRRRARAARSPRGRRCRPTCATRAELGRRGGRGRRGPRHLAQARRPPGLLRQGSSRSSARASTPAGAQRRRRDDVVGEPTAAAAILDVDGTLVDTNYHHALAWYRAFRQHGVVLPIWRIHRHIGMGGDQLVASLAGEEFDARARRRRARRREGAVHVADRRGRAARGRARADRGPARARARASCSPPPPRPTRSTTTSTCSTRASSSTAGRPRPTSRATKPEPDLVAAAVEKAGGGDAVMLGDSTWDCESAKRAGAADRRRADRRLQRAGAARRGRGRACSTRSPSCAGTWRTRRSA